MKYKLIEREKNSAFEICGEDGLFYPADAVLNNNSVIVSSNFYREQKTGFFWIKIKKGSDASFIQKCSHRRYADMRCGMTKVEI